jgi:glucose/mannose-6-phosphate isomerase
MLDDLKYIHQRDGQDALGIAERQAGQLIYKFERPKIEGEFTNIVYAGMGGSALAALFSRSWPGYSLPFEVCRQYQIPAYVSERTLFIAASNSGNTEETLSALAEAETKDAKIVIIAGGGKLAEIAAQKNYPYFKLPKAEQPRYAVFYNLVALLTTLEAAGLLGESDISAELEKASKFLTEAVKAWLPTVPTAENEAKKLANELAGKSGVVYGGPLMSPAAYKWKISFNENAKNIAWWNEFPEFNHNEFIGWSSHPVQKPYGVIELRSNLEHPRVQKRFEVSERLLSGKRPAPHVVNVQGESLLQQLVWAITFGDFVTIYLALLNNLNPAPVELVEKLKKELNN